MSFTQSAFIRKNTPELREKLNKLGYTLCKCCNYPEGWLFVSPSNGVHRIDEEEYGEFLGDIKKRSCEMIDCATDSNLFFALIALRDDSNNNQWFTNGKDWALYHDDSDGGLPGFEFFYFPYDMDTDKLHKATAEEIIEHFKAKKNE